MHGALDVSGIWVVAIADNCAWDVSHDLAISTALSRVSVELLAISFSLTLVELVPNTMRSLIISSGSLKSQFWAKMRSPVMNFSLNTAVEFESGEHRIYLGVDVSFEAFVVSS